MVIKIEDYEFGNDNFEYEIFVNGSKRATNVNASRELLIEAQSNDVVMIRAKNIVLSSKWGWLFMFFYWFLAILIGTGDNNPFGKPFDAYIQFKSNSTYIELKANKIRKLNAFEVLSGKLDIERNEFVNNKKYVIRWCVGFVLPINLLIVTIFGIFILAGISMSSMVVKVVIGILALCLISWNVYVYSILKCLKEK